MEETNIDLKLRLDKWLWAARFFKTRSQAAQAVTGGQVHVNETRVKPARNVQVGEELSIRRGNVEFVVLVQRVFDKRRPAVEAQTMYEETEESVIAREKAKDQQKLLALSSQGPVRRPTKRERRRIVSFTRKKR